MLLTKAQVAERLGVSIKTVERLVQRGHLIAVRPTGRVVRFEPAEIARFIEERSGVAS